MKKVVLFFALIVGFLTSASTLQAQVNTSRYVTLTVKSGEVIKFKVKVADNYTPIRVECGGVQQDYSIVDNAPNWSSEITQNSYSGTTMTIYGDIIGLNCGANGENLTAIDLSHNTQLTELNCSYNSLSTLDVSNNTQLDELYCSGNELTSLDLSDNTQLKTLWCVNNNLNSLDLSHNTQLTTLACYDNNNFSTQAIDDIYCSLPIRQASDNAKIYPIYQSTSTNNATVIASNAQNAIDKNWKVQYSQNNSDISTTGTYTCPQLNMSRYITLTVKNGEAIKLDLCATANITPIRIVSGSNTQDIIVNDVWKGNAHYTADGTTMIIYGDLKRFDCSGNGEKITALDVSNSPELETLLCHGNRISSLDVSKNTLLTKLDCSDNNLSSLDISKNTLLDKLYCIGNRISSLDISKNTKLTHINCSSNKLSSLGVSKNTKLATLYCHGNNFSTAALDDIYCALPDRTGNANGVVQPIRNSSSPDLATVLATNKQNAIAKNWKVLYYDNDTDIPATTGKHKCSATDIAEATAEPALTLYPNPVADMLYLSATARNIRIYNVYGTEVAHATDTDRIDVANLPAGVYTVKADDTVAKMVKR